MISGISLCPSPRAQIAAPPHRIKSKTQFIATPYLSEHRRDASQRPNQTAGSADRRAVRCALSHTQKLRRNSHRLAEQIRVDAIRLPERAQPRELVVQLLICK